MKNPPTLAGIEPATFRLVARHLNHCATAVPSINSITLFIINTIVYYSISIVLLLV